MARYNDKDRLKAAVRLIKALRDPEANTMKARSDVTMVLAQKELRDAEEHAKEVGLEF